MVPGETVRQEEGALGEENTATGEDAPSDPTPPSPVSVDAACEEQGEEAQVQEATHPEQEKEPPLEEQAVVEPEVPVEPGKVVELETAGEIETALEPEVDTEPEATAEQPQNAADNLEEVGGVSLEPLTPSKVLEHEVTEMLPASANESADAPTGPLETLTA